MRPGRELYDYIPRNHIHSISGKYTKPHVKIEDRDGQPPPSEQVLLEEWKDYFSSPLNKDSLAQSETPAAEDLPMCTHPLPVKK